MKILLIDDEIIALNALKKRVDWVKYGFTEVLTAQDANTAKHILEKNAVDMILCDIEMPGESGLELVEYVREVYPSTECVMVTCHADFNYVKKSIKLNVVDYILKPIDYDELDEMMLRFMQRHPASAEVENITEKPWENGTEDPAVRETALTQERIERVKQYIDEHIQEKIKMEDLAKRVYINEQYLMRIFKQQTGQTILEYITERRIVIASGLLKNTSYPLNYIANMVGCENYSYFTKMFKRSTGYTPREYRIQFKK